MDSPVLEYVQKEAISHPCTQQYSIPLAAMDKLNDKGQQLLQTCRERYKNGKIKDHFDQWSTIVANSGQCPPQNPGDAYILNTFNNLCIYTIVNNKYLKTSVVIMISPDNNWCYTLSGSLYSLNPDGFNEYLEK